MVDKDILGSIAAIKSRLTELKTDRTRFLTASDVIDLYSELANAIKGQDMEALLANGEERCALEDLILIFSLALLTVGITRHAVSTFSILLTMRSLLNYLVEEPNYTPKEVEVLDARVKDAREILSAGPTDPDLPYSPEIAALVGRMIDTCQNELLPIVKRKIKSVPPTDKGVFSQIIHFRREIFGAIVSPHFEPKDLVVLKEKVLKANTHIEATPHGSEEESQFDHEILMKQINSCIQFCDWFAAGPIVDESAKPIFNSLLNMSRDLEMFLMTYRWTLRGTDLYKYIYNLQDLVTQLDKATGCKWTYRGTADLPKGMTICFYLIRRSWAMIYKLVDNAEPVSESLSPIYNQLLTMKRCLIEVRDMGGISNLRELYPYQMKLASIDDLRDDGKFVVADEVPAGQGVLNALLAECYDLGDELKADLEEREDDDDKASVYEEEEDDDQEDEPIEGEDPDIDHSEEHSMLSVVDDETK